MDGSTLYDGISLLQHHTLVVVELKNDFSLCNHTKVQGDSAMKWLRRTEWTGKQIGCIYTPDNTYGHGSRSEVEWTKHSTGASNMTPVQGNLINELAMCNLAVDLGRNRLRVSYIVDGINTSRRPILSRLNLIANDEQAMEQAL